jgi:hypothetical protein
MTTLYEAKGQARRLAEFLASISLPVSHSQALEAVAHSHGAQNWNVFTSQLGEAGDNKSPATPMDRPDRELLTLQGLVEYAYRRESGPIHVSTRQTETRLFQRLRGKLQPFATLGAADSLALGLDMGSHLKGPPWHRAATVFIAGKEREVEAASVEVMDGHHIVLTLPRLPILHEMGITEIRNWSRLTKSPQGLVLVSGDSATGRDIVNATAGYRMFQAKHMSCYSSNGRSWLGMPSEEPSTEDYAQFIRTALRADPSVIVMEMRSPESVREALDAVNTGHFVIGVLHSNANPVDAIQRLMDLSSEPERTLERLDANLIGVLSQMPVHSLCEHCLGEGCNHCFETGQEPAEIVSSLWTRSGSEALRNLLEGKIPHRTLMDDIAVKQNLGLRYSEETLALLR